jgi:hypothetical protein
MYSEKHQHTMSTFFITAAIKLFVSVKTHRPVETHIASSNYYGNANAQMNDSKLSTVPMECLKLVTSAIKQNQFKNHV